MGRRRHAVRALAATLLVCLGVLFGVPSAAVTGVTSPAVRDETARTMTVSVYHFRQPSGLPRGPRKLLAAHRTVPLTPRAATAAVSALLRGPTPAERGLGVRSSVPAAARLLGLSIRNGVATVNLSREFWPRATAPWPAAARRLAQVVFTVTRFPTVRSVRLEVEGRPVAAPGIRAAYEHLAPPVLVESPAFNDPYRTPMRVEGTATGPFTLEVVDWDGRVVAATFVRLPDTVRSAFDATLRFTMGLYPRGGLLASRRGAGGRSIPLLDMPLGLTR